MALRKELDIDLADDDANGVCEDQSTSAAGALLLNGALIDAGTYRTSAEGVARILEITDTNTVDQSGVDFTFVGKDEQGTRVTYTRKGPGSGATVKTVKAFYEITSITVASPAGGSPQVSIGPANETLSGLRIVPLNPASLVAARVSCDITGTINFTVQETYDDRGDLANATFTDIAALADKTADTTSVAALGVTALRVEINSYSDGGEVQVMILQRRDGAF